MRVLLIVSPSFSLKMIDEEIANIQQRKNDFTKSVDWRPAPPLGILFLAAALRKSGHHVDVVDMQRAIQECRITEYFLTHNREQFFVDFFDKLLLKEKYELIGIGSLFNVSSSTVIELAQRVRMVVPHSSIVLGGHYPTVMFESLIYASVCDYILLGESEDVLVWLADNLNNAPAIASHPHIVTRGSDAKLKSPAMVATLDSLSPPAWDLLPFAEDYITNSIDAGRVGGSKSAPRLRSAALISTRGCPMQCTFCAAHQVHGRKVRSHSIEYMMDHINWLVDTYDINNLLIQDDMFNFDIARAINFCKKIYEKYSGRFNIEFPNGLAIWKVNEELIINLKKVGLTSITVAVESGSPYVQKHILKKNLNLEQVKNAIALLRSHGVGVRAFFIVGFVGETKSMMEETVTFALDLNLDWAEIKIFTPLVGSEMHALAHAKGYLSEDMSEHVYGRATLSTPEFTSQEVKQIQYDANIRVNFINNRQLREKKYEQAELIFKGLLKSFPDHLFAQLAVWQSLVGQNKVSEAASALTRLRELVQASENNRELLARHQIILPAAG